MTSVFAATLTDPVRCHGRCRDDFQQQVLAQIRAGLGLPRQAPASRHGHSRNTTLFHLVADSGAVVVVKIDDSKPATASDTEYRSLESLHDMGHRSHRFCCPAPRMLLEGKGVYACTLLRGHAWASEVLDGRTDPVRSGARLGRALAEIHGRWQQPTQDLGSLTADLPQHSPFIRGLIRRRLVETATEFMDGLRVPWARLHADFDPVNLLHTEGTVGLLDPPDKHLVGPVHWDLAVFTIGMTRARARHPRHLQRAAGAKSRRHRAAFLDAYNRERERPWSSADEVLLTLMELGRLSQLWVWAAHPWRSHQRMRRTARTAAALPVVRLLAEQRMARLRQLTGVRL